MAKTSVYDRINFRSGELFVGLIRRDGSCEMKFSADGNGVDDNFTVYDDPRTVANDLRRIADWLESQVGQQEEVNPRTALSITNLA